MIAVVTSIGETTTDLCIWSLERQGFEVALYKSNTSLWQKLKDIYSTLQDDFIRVDADVIVNNKLQELIMAEEMLWFQALTFDWYKMDLAHGGIQYIRKPCIKIINKHIDEAQRLERPETYLSRLDEFYNPRSFGTFDKICGIHGYKQADLKRVKDTKMRRKQWGNYDWELAERIEAL